MNLSNNIGTVFNKYYKLMLYEAQNILGNQRDAEDAIQNLFLKIAKHPEPVISIPDDQIKPYIIISSRNAARDLYRKRENGDIPIDILDIDIFDKSGSPEDKLMSKLENLELFNLPMNDVYREIIILKYYFQFADNVISDILNISESNVRVRLLRSRHKIKELLEVKRHE